jgi:hypothetical protein
LEYDPWEDIDGDGKITLYDAVSLLNSYGAQGDPTRNVTVTNFPLDAWGNLRTGNVTLGYDLQYFTVNCTILPFGGGSIALYSPPMFSCGGYSRISILATAINISENVGDCTITLYLNCLNWMSGKTLDPIPALEYEIVGANAFNITIRRFYYGGQWNFEWVTPQPFVTTTKAPYCYLEYHAMNYTSLPPEGLWIEVGFYAYLRNE